MKSKRRITAVPRNCLDLSKLNVCFSRTLFIFGRENLVRFFGNFVERPSVIANFKRGHNRNEIKLDSKDDWNYGAYCILHFISVF